ncbi:helix-turn-helix domain-containing protein [Mycolicibacterium fortuitum]|uniref:helix-turn-helix domain-containing protein n=1 Tax=Mycolicibacterium fortuitum TaxID=1766 RepID=UPI0007F03A30|nr:helix-turn-helix domain-containing protein [Mycolicibacterium fortuitum]MDG5770537.1 helix-turn-helix domain-containing protein [Mycolicibacterium fortuitum]MDG5781996.1 helix-turn-helix domain-containing protein [Mycolicibacterium fortuitum]OBK60199.1 Fis family transcriptional regulator [Mycolicibacterium fortuitum]
MLHVTDPQTSVPRPIRERVEQLIRDRQRALGEDRRISPSVLQSWLRSVRYGLSPAQVGPCGESTPEQDMRLLDAAVTVMRTRIDGLTAAESCLFLTNAAGVILRHWVGDDALMARLAKLDIEPGFLVSETTLGTTSGSTLITATPTFVRGPEHFGMQFLEFTSAGMVITHPVTQRIVGSINLISRFRDTSPLAVPWVCDIATEVERCLLDAATTAEQGLMRAFVNERRDARHAVVAVNEKTVVANAAATRMLGSVDQAVLWEYAARVLSDPGAADQPAALGGPRPVVIDHHTVVSDGSVIGVVLKLKRAEVRNTEGPAIVELPGMVGHSERWTALLNQLARTHASPGVLLVGERGVGKSAIARACCTTSYREIDAAASAADPQWVTNIAAPALNAPDHSTVIIHHLDQLAPAMVTSLCDALTHRPAPSRVFATSATWPHRDHATDPALVTFPTVISVPPLSERSADLPVLVAHFTAEAGADREPVQWMPDALRALARVDWSDNIAGLKRLVTQIVSETGYSYISAKELPTHLAAITSRRRLVGLERAEATAIVDAIKTAGGNKHQAAAKLGIARSTLYRKMRSLGIDMDDAVL